MASPRDFAARLRRVAEQAERRAEELEQRWGDFVEQEMRHRVPVRTGKLRDSIRQVRPGVVEVGADYGIYVDRGTAHMPPQEFVRPSVNQLRKEEIDDAVKEVVRWLTGG
jgi:HK97 gp10 family phage protein